MKAYKAQPDNLPLQDVLPSYDDRQLAAVLTFRPCCGSWVWATAPEGKCGSC